MHLLEPWYLIKEVVPLSEDKGKTKFLSYKNLIGDAIQGQSKLK